MSIYMIISLVEFFIILLLIFNIFAHRKPEAEQDKPSYNDADESELFDMSEYYEDDTH